MQCSRLCVLALVAAAACAGTQLEEFEEEYIWSRLDFAFPDDSTRAEALKRMQYEPDNNALAGIKVWRDRIYLTLPRWKPGVPATLASIPAANNGRSSPALEPFPSWDMQTVGNCTAFQFVQNIEIDKRGRMWVLDSGSVNTLTNSPNTHCRPKLVLIDLESTMPGSLNMTAKILQTFNLPDSVLSRDNNSLLVDLVLDTDDVVYISDASESDPGIIVYNTGNGQAWKVRDPSMRADPLLDAMVDGRRISFKSNVNALALTPVPAGTNSYNPPNRTLFYSPLNSYNLYAVSTSILRDKSSATGGNVHNSVMDLGNKTSFSQGMIVDSHGVMYLGLNSMDAVARWDTRKLPLKDNLHVFTKDQVRMQWPSTFAFDTAGSLWVISNRLQNFLAGSVNLQETNYRVMRAVTNSSSYLYPEDRPAELPVAPAHTDHMDHDHMGHDHMDHTHRPGQMDHGNQTHSAAESVARPATTVLAILTSIMTFIFTLA